MQAAGLGRLHVLGATQMQLQEKLAVGLLALAGSAVQAGPLDLAATLTYSYHAVTADGVTKESRFQEKLYRVGNQVWTERILPANAPRDAKDGHDEHEHKHDLGLAAAAKHIVRDARGNLSLNFVRRADRQIIHAEQRDYSELGFDGSWEGAYYIVNPQQLQKMQRLKRPAAAGEVWYELRQQDRFVRVLWSEARQLPLLIESGSFDGSLYAKTEIKSEALPRLSQLPWNQLAHYQRKDYVDLLD